MKNISEKIFDMKFQKKNYFSTFHKFGGPKLAGNSIEHHLIPPFLL